MEHRTSVKKNEDVLRVMTRLEDMHFIGNYKILFSLAFSP